MRSRGRRISCRLCHPEIIPKFLIVSDELARQSDMFKVLEKIAGISSETVILLWSMKERHDTNSKFKIYFDTSPRELNTARRAKEQKSTDEDEGIEGNQIRDRILGRVFVEKFTEVERIELAIAEAVHGSEIISSRVSGASVTSAYTSHGQVDYSAAAREERDRRIVERLQELERRDAAREAEMAQAKDRLGAELRKEKERLALEMQKEKQRVEDPFPYIDQEASNDEQAQASEKDDD
ncbi:hypothetical protein LINPERHAP1_LOCUS21689 [Linum perenne]